MLDQFCRGESVMVVGNDTVVVNRVLFTTNITPTPTVAIHPSELVINQRTIIFTHLENVKIRSHTSCNALCHRIVHLVTFLLNNDIPNPLNKNVYQNVVDFFLRKESSHVSCLCSSLSSVKTNAYVLIYTFFIWAFQLFQFFNFFTVIFKSFKIYSKYANPARPLIIRIILIPLL